MYDQLTKEDIALMRAELYDLETNKRPAIIAEVQRCREFGDLSENYEYKAAKQEQRAMDSRIRYLNNMIRTARIVEQAPADEDAKGVRLFDKVTIYIPEDEEEMVIRGVHRSRSSRCGLHQSGVSSWKSCSRQGSGADRFRSGQ